MIAVPEAMTVAAADWANIASAVDVAHTAAAAPTVAVIPAAADEVSSSIAQLFSRHAQDYQALARRAATFQQQLVQRLTSSAGTYAGAEVANVVMLQTLATGTGAAAASGGQLVASVETALIFAMALATVPFYALMVSPFLLVIGLALIIAGFAFIIVAIEKIAAGLL